MVILYGFLYCVGLWSCDFREVMSKTTLELYGMSSQLTLVQEGYLLYIVQGAFKSQFPQFTTVIYVHTKKYTHRIIPKVSQTGGTGPQFLLKWG